MNSTQHINISIAPNTSPPREPVSKIQKKNTKPSIMEYGFLLPRKNANGIHNIKKVE